MPELTEHYDLTILGAGETIAEDGFKFADLDRRRIDHLLWLGAEAHHHTGDPSVAGDAPDIAPQLIVEVEGGSLPPATTFYYVFTLVDLAGQESGPSPVATAVTPPPVDSPAAPTLVDTAVGGTLGPGNYLYVLSAYTEFDTLETVAGDQAFIQIPAVTATNLVTITFPALPAGATGFNVYRQAPGGQDLTFLATVDMSVAIPPATLVDDGSLDDDCTRFAPTVATAASANAVEVTLPDDPITFDPYELPLGYSWRLYRSTDPDDFVDTLIAIVDDASITFLDVGDAAGAGSPPGSGVAVGSPPKVDLQDGVEVQGTLPMSQVSGFPFTFEWSFPGPVVVMEGTSVWVCEFPQATIVGVRAALGRGSAPDDFDVIVDVLAGSGQNPVYASMFDLDADRPRVLIGDQIGERVPPTLDAELLEGDSLVFDVVQQGGADPDTQGDRDLVVIVYGYAYGYTDPLSHPWEPTGSS